MGNKTQKKFITTEVYYDQNEGLVIFDGHVNRDLQHFATNSEKR